jgi:hypothetical protein
VFHRLLRFEPDMGHAAHDGSIGSHGGHWWSRERDQLHLPHLGMERIRVEPRSDGDRRTEGCTVGSEEPARRGGQPAGDPRLDCAREPRWRHPSLRIPHQHGSWWAA